MVSNKNKRRRKDLLSENNEVACGDSVEKTGFPRIKYGAG